MSNRYLPTALRRALEKAVKDARIVAEEGARDAIRRLGVAEGKVPSYLSKDEKDLRRRLRAHARALGDAFDRTDETQETRRLIEVSAYAHWHRMLFARFLAERGLLRNPEYDVAVTLEDCRELSEAEGLTDAWAIAERYSAVMLPAVFRIDDPVLAIALDPVHTQELHRLVTGLDAEVFQAEDSLGWTYQFWRAAEKDAVNKSGIKIGADELPAVTQLFTEPYMVRFLLHNTLGAWWAGKVLAANPALARTAADEGALRVACSLPDYSFDMLRFVRGNENGPWRPAAGAFPDWPTKAKAITMLDPCCGSGHFLTEALAILAALRQAEESLSSADAVAAALRDNLHGLEIDERCVQIAAFAVALTVWRIGGWQTLPVPNIAWVGAPPPLPKREFVNMAEEDDHLAAGLGAIYELFVQAPALGSLIDPRGGDLADSWRLGNAEPLMESLLEKSSRAEPEILEGAISARGLSNAAAILSTSYTLLATNVPYLVRGKQGSVLRNFTKSYAPDLDQDLATVFLKRCYELTSVGGSYAIVSPNNWIFLKSYEAFRKRILDYQQINLIAKVGSGATAQASWDTLRALTVITRPSRGADLAACGLSTDAVEEDSRAADLTFTEIVRVTHSELRKKPDQRFVFSSSAGGKLLSEFADSLQGPSTGDFPRFGRLFHEVEGSNENWEFQQSTIRDTAEYAGCRFVVKWENGQGELSKYEGAAIRGVQAIGRSGITVTQMRSLPCSLFAERWFDNNVAVLIPKKNDYLGPIWAYCSSSEYARDVRQIDEKLGVTNASLTKVVFDETRWRSAFLSEHNGHLPPPSSNDPAQWLFHGHPADADMGKALHVALVRLSGYRWPAETNDEIRLSYEARALVAKAEELPAGDNDGLLGVPAIAGEKPLADRLRAYLAAVFGSEWSDALERRLVAEADEVLDKKKGRDGSLEIWLGDRAFRQHCALFGQRPFLWHISDGLKDGFSVFVHYHRFDQANMRKLTYTLLGDWLARAKTENNALRYEKGRELQQMLERVLEGEGPYDIFVRWKSLAQQPLGWEPDLDDGVRQNIRPFIKAGVLTHDLSKILKDKDRGNDATSAPWYPVFKGERRNGHHTTLAEKRDAAAKLVEAAK